MRTRGLMGLIERFLPWLAVIMIVSVIVRSVAAIVMVSTPYDSWPLIVRLGVEVVAALGMVVAADAVFSCACKKDARLTRQLHETANSPEYQPSPRTSGARLQNELARLSEAKAAALSAIRSERRTERVAMAFSGAVNMTYGLLFALSIARQASLAVILTEVIGIGMIPAILWYLTARYTPEEASPTDTAQSLSLEAVERALQRASDRIASGDLTPNDIRMLQVGANGSPLHRRLVEALRNVDEPVYTPAQLYNQWRIVDARMQATIRRRIARAGKENDRGISIDSESGGWRIAESAVYRVLREEFGAAMVATFGVTPTTGATLQPMMLPALNVPASSERRTGDDAPAHQPELLALG